MATATTRDAALEVTARKEVEEEEEHWDRGTEGDNPILWHHTKVKQSHERSIKSQSA